MKVRMFDNRTGNILDFFNTEKTFSMDYSTMSRNFKRALNWIVPIRSRLKKYCDYRHATISLACFNFSFQYFLLLLSAATIQDLRNASFFSTLPNPRLPPMLLPSLYPPSPHQTISSLVFLSSLYQAPPSSASFPRNLFRPLHKSVQVEPLS